MTNKSKTATEAVIIILMMSPVPAPIKPFTSELNLITPEPANAHRQSSFSVALSQIEKQSVHR